MSGVEGSDANPAAALPPRPPVPAPAPVAAPVAVGDPYAYRIAVGGIGLALVAFLIGAAIIAAGGNPVPTQYWSAGGGLAGGLLGILAPSPTRKPVDAAAPQKNVVLTAVGDLWNNRGMTVLLVVFILSAVLAGLNSSPELETVAAAAGGALVGLLAPPPGH